MSVQEHVDRHTPGLQPVYFFAVPRCYRTSPVADARAYRPKL